MTNLSMDYITHYLSPLGVVMLTIPYGKTMT